MHACARVFMCVCVCKCMCVRVCVCVCVNVFVGMIESVSERQRKKERAFVYLIFPCFSCFVFLSSYSSISISS